MEINYFWHLLKTKKLTIFSTWLIFIIIGSAVTFLQPLKYEAKSRLLIVQNVAGIDPYTISKSNQYLSNLFAQVVHSNSFFDLVTNSNNFDVDKGYFQTTYKKQMEIWEKTISANSLNDTGIIEISIYHPNPYQAKELALAANDVLINQGFNYQGGGDNIKVKIIDQPLVSDYPVKPNIIFNLIAFSILGLIVGASYLYFFPGHQFTRSVKVNSAPLVPSYARQNNPVRTANPATNNYSQPNYNNSPKENLVSNDSQPDNNNQIKGNINNLLPRF